MEHCLACDLSAGRVRLPGGTIHETRHWRVEHCVGPLGLGTLIVKPKRHVVAVPTGQPSHIHYVIQPVRRDETSSGARLYGPALQVALFTRGQLPATNDIVIVADRARRAFRDLS